MAVGKRLWAVSMQKRPCYGVSDSTLYGMLLLCVFVQSKMAVGKRLWGETLDADRPSIAQNKAAIAAAAQKQQQQQLRRQSSDVGRSVSQQLPPLGEEEDSVSMSNSSNSSNSLVTAETWLVLE